MAIHMRRSHAKAQRRKGKSELMATLFFAFLRPLRETSDSFVIGYFDIRHSKDARIRLHRPRAGSIAWPGAPSETRQVPTIQVVVCLKLSFMMSPSGFEHPARDLVQVGDSAQATAFLGPWSVSTTLHDASCRCCQGSRSSRQ